MQTDNNPKANPNIVLRPEGEEALLFNPDSGLVKVLNETGKFIWRNLDGKNSPETLVSKIMDAFDISDEKKTREDLEKFLEDLEKLKFLEEK